MRRFTVYALALILAAVVAAACGDDDEGPVLTPTAPPGSPTLSPTGTPPVQAATPNPLVASLTQSPQYFEYQAATGDTLVSVAKAFGVQEAELRRVNQLSSDTLAPGTLLAVPLALPGDLALIPDATMETALGITTGSTGRLALLQPSLALREGYLGRLVLHAVRLLDDNPKGEGRGYVTSYALTDRPPSKGGVPDPNAKIAGFAFLVASGPLVKELQAANLDKSLEYVFTRDGVEYYVQVAPGSPRTAQQLAAMLQTAKER